MTRLGLLVFLLALPSFAAAPPSGCVGSLPIATFRLLAQQEKGGPTRAVRLINRLGQGDKLKYEPLRIPDAVKAKAQIALVLVTPAQDLTVLDPLPAGEGADWKVPGDISVVALIFGPHGLNVKKVKSLITKNQELLSQLADYAEQTEKVEGLVEAISSSEKSGGSLDAALAGFSAQYSVGLPKLDNKASTDQQAGLLLKALMPSVSAYDPLQARSAVQQSTGLAASVATLFFGTPVGLAAGGASLFQNLRTAMFPETEFRSAIAHPTNPDGLSLCTKNQQPKPHTRLAFLWAHRIPDLAAPHASLTGSPHLPIGVKSVVKGDGFNHLERAHDWTLVASDGKTSFPVPVTFTPGSDILTIDLPHTKAPPGEYRLAAQWDWAGFQISGTLHLHAIDNFQSVRLTTRSHDSLLEGAGRVPVELTGADFEFVEKVALEKDPKRRAAPTALAYTLPKGKGEGEQRSFETEIDTTGLTRGDYRLLLTQADGKTYEVPIRVLAPNPKLDNLPVRVNLGEPRQRLALHGSGLERIERVTTDAGTVELGAGGPFLKLREGARKGDEYAIQIKVKDVEEPITVPNAIVVAGPRPKITGFRKSLAGAAGIPLQDGELPAGLPVSFELSVANLDASPSVDLACGERAAHVTPQIAGQGVLFFSLDPGTIAQSGCRLSATVTTPSAGTSDPQPLGQLVRLPRIDSFQLTDEKLGEAVYAGVVRGQDLETIEKTGWDAEHGLPVQALPTPVAGKAREQELKIPLPWPAPSPHAPLFVWLRGENAGRPTGVKY